MADLIFDIETVPAVDWDSLDPYTREYLCKRQDRKAREEEVDADDLAADRLALDLGLAKVAAIGLCNEETGAVSVLVEQRGDAEATVTDAGVKILPMPEEEMLRRWWKWMHQYDRLISFNGRTYDGPVLHIRSAQLGIASTRELVTYRYDCQNHCDLAEILTWNGTLGWRSTFNFGYWCARAGVATPKAEVDGSKIAALYAAGEMMKIAGYAGGDVTALRGLYHWTRRSFLHLFKGAPPLLTDGT